MSKISKYEEIKDKFSDKKRKEIDYALSQGFIYINHEFDYDQMYEITLGLENGLTIEQVKIYADLKFNYLQMYEIRLGLEAGLSIEEINLYANPKFDYEQMRKIRWRFVRKISINHVKRWISKQKINRV